MKRNSLKCGGHKRHKALFGADGAIQAAATLAAAGMTVAATAAAASKQSKAMVDNARTQAESIRETNANNTALQKESIEFTKQQNAENRQQQQDIQATLQMMAGQETMNDRMRASKVAVKYGGKPKRKSVKSTPSYGGAQQPFNVTDGGGAIPLAIDANGYGLYELYGNDHEHYHKAPGGKNKTGVGIKFPDGSVVEGEGNQNSNQGELMYVTPEDALFLSKHSINGFNPTQAVLSGVHPVEAFNAQEMIKQQVNLNDDGTRRSRYSLRRNQAEDGKGVIYYDPERGHRVINRERVGNAIQEFVAPVMNPLRRLAGTPEYKVKEKPKPGGFGGGRTGGGGASGVFRNMDEFEYINKTDTIWVPAQQTFNDAFGRARRMGLREFEFNGNRYNTNVGNNPDNNRAGQNRTQTVIVPIERKYKEKRRVDKTKKEYGGQNILMNAANITQLPSNGTVAVGGGTAYAVNNLPRYSSPVEGNVAKCGKRISLKKCGGSRRKAAWGDYAGATYNSIGNLLGAGLTTWGNMWAGNKLGQAYQESAGILADAYRNLQTIDENLINKEDYDPGSVIAVMRNTDTNINPQLERLRRNADSERREINRETLSSAARQQRLAGVNDRMYQRVGEAYADKYNKDEAIKQQNNQTINQTAQFNAQLKSQANQAYAKDRLSLKQYNNDIVNQRVLGAADAVATGNTQAIATHANALQSSMNAIGSAIGASGNAFGTAFDTQRKYQMDRANTLIGADTERQVLAAIQTGNSREAQGIYTAMQGIVSAGNDKDGSAQRYMDMLKAKYPGLS